MKTKFLTFSFLFLLSFNVLAKSELGKSFAPVGTEWHYGFVSHLFGSVGHADYYHFVSTGDTLIEGRLCNIIEQKHGVNICRESPLKTYVSQSNDTVFLWVPQMNKFTPLYLFGAVKGDSWIISHPAGDVKVVVDSVSTVSWFGSVSKQQFVTYHYNWQNSDLALKSSIIEGIGDYIYLFNYAIHTLALCDDWKMPEGLRCYSNPQQGSQKWTTLSCDTVFDINRSAKTYLGESDSWNELQRSSELYGKPNIVNHTIVGDTIIGNVKYKAVYKTNDSLYLPRKAQFGCGIREDNGKWYFRFSGDSKEIMYYDFGMKVGDSLIVDYGPIMKAVYYVLKIDTVVMNGQSRKRFDIGFKSGNGFYLVTHWMEGVGCDDGLLPTSPFIGMTGYELLCYHHNNDLVYMNPKYNSCSLTTNKVVSTLKDGDSWNIVNISGGWYGVSYSSFNYTLKGDTIINSKVYKPVYYSVDSVNVEGQSSKSFYLREEAGRWYYTYSGDVSERLLYDFNLKVGDTVLVQGVDSRLRILKVDSIIISGIPHKRLYIGYNYELSQRDNYVVDEWIEGIGSNKGLLYDYWIVDAGSDLLCFKKKGELIYMNPNYNICWVVSGIDNTKMAQPLILKSASNGDFEIQCRDLIEELTISDIRGATISKCFPSGSNYVFSLKGQQKGVFVLRIKTDSGVYTRKIVKK